MIRKGLSPLSGNKRLRLSLAASFLIILSIPVALYAILMGNSFDTSSSAAPGDQIYYCNIQFLYVDPNSLQVDNRVHVQASVTLPNLSDSVRSITIVDNSGAKIFDKSYTGTLPSVGEVFIFKPTQIGTQTILGTVTTATTTYPCTVLGATGNSVKILNLNTAPAFSTDPKSDSDPGQTFDVGGSYKYELRAADSDEDDIQYSYSFTPGASWLKMSAIKDGSNGELVLNFSGKPETPGSFLANVFIHDGYNQHLRSQSWVISVEQGENDIPKVEVILPEGGTSVEIGDILTISWNATDLNQIVRYKLYYATNPGDQSSWKVIDEDVSYKVGTYKFDTEGVAAGQYKIIVQAVDNQTPEAVGSGISEQIGIGMPAGNDNGSTDGGDDEGPDDGVQLTDPQIINIRPSDKSKTTNKRISISANLIAGSEAEIDKDSLEFKLDDKDLSGEVELRDINESEVSLTYRPDVDLTNGEHKISVMFQDSKDRTTERSWVFTIEDKNQDDEGDTVNLLGYEIPRRTAYIIAAGIGIILLALLIPWLLYVAWRNSDDDDQELDIYNTYPTPKSGGSAGSPTTTNVSEKATYYPKVQNKSEDTGRSVSTVSTTQTLTPAKTPAAQPIQSSSSTTYRPVINGAPTNQSSSVPANKPRAAYDTKSEPAPIASVQPVVNQQIYQPEQRAVTPPVQHSSTPTATVPLPNLSTTSPTRTVTPTPPPPAPQYSTSVALDKPPVVQRVDTATIPVRSTPESQPVTPGNLRPPQPTSPRPVTNSSAPIYTASPVGGSVAPQSTQLPLQQVQRGASTVMAPKPAPRPTQQPISSTPRTEPAQVEPKQSTPFALQNQSVSAGLRSNTIPVQQPREQAVASGNTPIIQNNPPSPVNQSQNILNSGSQKQPETTGIEFPPDVEAPYKDFAKPAASTTTQNTPSDLERLAQEIQREAERRAQWPRPSTQPPTQPQMGGPRPLTGAAPQAPQPIGVSAGLSSTQQVKPPIAAPTVQQPTAMTESQQPRAQQPTAMPVPQRPIVQQPGAVTVNPTQNPTNQPVSPTATFQQRNVGSLSQFASNQATRPQRF